MSGALAFIVPSQDRHRLPSGLPGMEDRGMALAATDFQLLANAGFPPAKFEPGEVIFSEGDKGDKMYVVRSGEIEVERDGKIVETLSGGGIFEARWPLLTARRGRQPHAPRRLAKSRPSPRRPSCSWCMKRRSSPSP